MDAKPQTKQAFLMIFQNIGLSKWLIYCVIVALTPMFIPIGAKLMFPKYNLTDIFTDGSIFISCLGILVPVVMHTDYIKNKNIIVKICYGCCFSLMILSIGLYGIIIGYSAALATIPSFQQNYNIEAWKFVLLSILICATSILIGTYCIGKGNGKVD